MSPTPDEILNARKSVGLTQPQAAAVIQRGGRMWAYTESGEREFDPILWQAWKIRVGLAKPESIL